MKSLFALFVAASLFFSASAVHAQADPTAKRSGALQVGLAYSNANTDEVTKRIGGVSVYASFDLFRNLGVEANVNLLDGQTPQDFAEQTYLVGLRYSRHYRHFQPYVKAMAGIGKTIAQEPYVLSFAPNTPGTFGAYSLGAGLDYHLSHNINIRAIDFEQQLWPGFSPNGLSPRMVTFGVAYRFR